MPTRKPKYSMNGLLLAGIILVFLGLFFFIEGLVHIASTDKPQFYNIEDAYSSCGVGAVCLITGAACLFFEFKRRIRTKELFNAGNYIMAEIVDITINYLIGAPVNFPLGHPYIVVCRYKDAKAEEHTFYSRNLYFDPKPFLKEKMVKVYIQDEDFKPYYVDIDEILQKREYY
ncbi:MAG: hypothetical protein HDR13_14310 [Lachnospiraceae bacterium]|nr:hypothetical protein [Lachnospiraceae bacterium]